LGYSLNQMKPLGLRSRRGRWVVGALLALAGLFLWDLGRFWRLTSDYAALGAQGNRRLPPPIPEEAIVVLTGAVFRIPRAIELLKVRSSPVLIISGTGKFTTLTDLANSQGDAIYNIQEVWSRIVMESRSSSTIENVEETEKLLAQRNVRRVLLVTSDYHYPRALALFHKMLPQYEFIPYPVASVHEVSFDSLSRWWGEYWKYLSYRIVDKSGFYYSSPR